MNSSPLQISWTVSEDIQALTRKVAFVIMAAWLIVIGSKYVIPSQRASGRGIGAGKMLAALGICIILMDLNLFISVLNGLTKALSNLWSMITSIKFG